MKKLICTVVVAILAIQTVQGAVLDFEDLYLEPVDTGPIPTGYAGFTWSANANFLTSRYGYNPDSGFAHGTIGEVCLGTANAADISMGGTTFDFLGAYITSAWNTNHSFTVEGWKSGALVYSESDITSYESAHWFDFNFYDIDTLWFKPGSGVWVQGLGGIGDHLAIDNITFIPEPMTVSLLAFGGLLLRKRRA